MNAETKTQAIARVAIVPIEFDILDVDGKHVGRRTINASVVVPDLEPGQVPVAILGSRPNSP